MSGSLVLVATPIGNLGDIAPRAVEVLESADRILCEDTRRTRVLLSALGIGAGGRLRALHEHNEASKVAEVLEALEGGEIIALVSDAGTPAISDPGERVVSAAAAAGLSVTTVPGPSSVLAALCVSGLDCSRFCVEGFLPRRGPERRARLAALAEEERTTVLLESPRRLGASLSELAAALDPERRVVVAREMTKLHEEVWRGGLAEAAGHFAEREVKGEIVVVLAGAQLVEAQVDDAQIAEHVAAGLAAGLSRRDAAQATADELGVAKRRCYEIASSLRT